MVKPMDINEEIKKMKLKRNNIINKEEKKDNNYISHLFTRTLISIILVLGFAIYTQISDDNLLYFKKKFFSETLPFAKINEIYNKYFGNITPVQKEVAVSKTQKNYTNIEKKDNSYELSLNGNTFSYLESGIIVFAGSKDNLGNTIIVQGIDGIDYWYSNLENVNVTLYDYVNKDSLIGEFNSNKAILTLMKDNNYLDANTYLK